MIIKHNKNGDNYMKDRELYLNRIQIDDTYSMQIEPEEQESLIIYENDTVIENFSLRRRIYTLFRTLQDYTKADEFVYDKEKKYKMYGKAIHIMDNIYMQINDEHDSSVVEFYEKENDHKKLLYIMKMNYMTQKLFQHILIPKKVLSTPDFQTMNPNLFKDFVDIVSVIKI